MGVSVRSLLLREGKIARQDLAQRQLLDSNHHSRDIGHGAAATFIVENLTRREHSAIREFRVSAVSSRAVGLSASSGPFLTPDHVRPCAV